MGKIKFKVMSYNVQCFDYINSQADVQRKIMEKNNCPVVCMQELSTSRRLKPAGEAALAGYPHIYFSEHKAFLGFASKDRLRNVLSRDFRNQDPQDMIQYGQTRAYQIAELEIGGKTITLINVHLCFLTQEVKFRQMTELFEIAQKQKYAVITGDFNCFAKTIGDSEYANMYRPFIQAGYHLADCDGSITKTWTDKINPGSLAEFNYPTDNIIVSPWITMKKVWYDKTKLKYPNGYEMDHIPIIAQLEIR